MLKINSINIKNNYKLFISNNLLVYSRNTKLFIFNTNKIILIHTGNRFIRRVILSINVSDNIGSLSLTRKIFAKPINKLKLKL